MPIPESVMALAELLQRPEGPYLFDGDTDPAQMVDEAIASGKAIAGMARFQCLAPITETEMLVLGPQYATAQGVLSELERQWPEYPDATVGRVTLHFDLTTSDGRRDCIQAMQGAIDEAKGD